MGKKRKKNEKCDVGKCFLYCNGKRLCFLLGCCCLCFMLYFIYGHKICTQCHIFLFQNMQFNIDISFITFPLHINKKKKKKKKNYIIYRLESSFLFFIFFVIFSFKITKIWWDSYSGLYTFQNGLKQAWNNLYRPEILSVCCTVAFVIGGWYKIWPLWIQEYQAKGFFKNFIFGNFCTINFFFWGPTVGHIDYNK